MLTQAWNSTADSAVALLLHYIFDLGGYNARELVERWLRFYPANWVRLAAIEALYQGRYKAVSVEQILSIWQRRGQIQPHFNCEFERLVCGNIQPRLSGRQSHPVLPVTHSHPIAIESTALRSHSNGACRSSGSKPEVIHRQPASVAALKVAAQAISNNIQAREASERESQRDRHYPSLDRRSSSPSSSLPKSIGSHHQPPIRQFNPGTTKTSDFYTKLKAISQHH
jgi:hypothetical protein